MQQSGLFHTKLDEDFSVLKNIDDFLLFAETLDGLEQEIAKLIKMCKWINLKLSPSKFALSKAVKFGGTVISAEKIKGQEIVFLDPPEQRILGITDMPPPLQKKSYSPIVA